MFAFQKRRRLNWQATEWLRCRYRKLIMTRPAKTQSPPDPGPELVPFRLDIANRTQLAAQAAQLGIKRNVLARDLVIRALNEPAETTSLLLALNQQVFALREELTLIAEVVLTHGGKLNQKEAQKWVDENLKPAE